MARQVLIISRKKTSFFNDLMLAAIKTYWKNPWPCNLVTAEDSASFAKTLVDALKSAPEVVMLVLEDQVPVNTVIGDMLNFAAVKIEAKAWASAATFMNPRIPVGGMIEGGWARINEDSIWKGNMQVTVWDKTVLQKIVDQCLKEYEGKGHVTTPNSFDHLSAGVQAGMPVYRAVLSNPWPMPHSGLMWTGQIWLPEINCERQKHGLPLLSKPPIPVVDKKRSLQQWHEFMGENTL